MENVIKHVHGRNNQWLHIDIQIEMENDELSICVEDNGTGFDVQKADLGFGLFSIQERLRLLFGDEAGFNIDSVPVKGTKVRIWIPIDDLVVN